MSEKEQCLDMIEMLDEKQLRFINGIISDLLDLMRKPEDIDRMIEEAEASGFVGTFDSVDEMMEALLSDDVDDTTDDQIQA